LVWVSTGVSIQESGSHFVFLQVLEGRALKVKVARDMRPQQGRLSPSNQTPLQNSTSQNQNTHTSVRASLNAAPSVSATGARSGISSADTAQVTHRLDPTVSAPRSQDSNLDGMGAHVAGWPPELRHLLAIARENT
jgi:hypothetical protein